MRYWVHYMAVCNDVSPPRMQGGAVPYEQPVPITTFDNVMAMAGSIADAVGQQRNAPPNTISVTVLGWTKLEESLVHVPGGRMQ